MSNEARLRSLGVEYSKESDENFEANFVYSDIKKGMGLTLGNAFRRILLSQIEGHAIRCVTINDINHEFTEIQGVKESAQELIINLKKVVFSGQPKSTKAVLNVKKDGPVYASDIKGINLTVANPHEYICTINSGASLKVEMQIEKSSGIILARDVSKREFEVDAIICDSFFSPVEKVNFEVEELENEKQETLHLSIRTNGSVTPHEALKEAVSVIKSEIAKFSDESYDVTSEASMKKINVANKNLFLRVSDIPGVSTRIINCLSILNIEYVGQLVKRTKEELLQKPNFGESSLNQLVESLNAMGLNLGMDIDWSPPEDQNLIV